MSPSLFSFLPPSLDPQLSPTQGFSFQGERAERSPAKGELPVPGCWAGWIELIPDVRGRGVWESGKCLQTESTRRRVSARGGGGENVKHDGSAWTSVAKIMLTRNDTDNWGPSGV